MRFYQSFENICNLSRIFDNYVERYELDRKFCIPKNALDLFERSEEVEFILLGTKEFGNAFFNLINRRYKVAFVVDDFKANRGELFCGAEIISSDKFIDINKKGKKYIAVNTCRFDYSRRYFETLCREQSIPLINFEQAMRMIGASKEFDHRLADWSEFICENKEKYHNLAKQLIDDYSKITLYSVLNFHLTCDVEWILNIARPYSTLYFRSGLLSLGDRERFVDGGASIGESTTALIDVTNGCFERIWMVEPDKYNIETLSKLMRKIKAHTYREKITLNKCALSNSMGTMLFNHTGHHGGSLIFDGNDTSKGEAVELTTIDKLVETQPTIIKLDIEGAELSALKGAKNTITAAKPKLFVSAYHRFNDLIAIPEYINEIRSDYKIGIRHHTEDRWDTCLYFY